MVCGPAVAGKPVSAWGGGPEACRGGAGAARPVRRLIDCFTPHCTHTYGRPAGAA